MTLPRREPVRGYAKVPNRMVRDDLFPAMTTRLYAELDSFARGEDRLCYPKIEKLAADLGWARRTVIRHLKKLAEAGWIRKTRRGPKGNLYKLCAPDGSDALGKGDPGVTFSEGPKGDPGVTPISDPGVTFGADADLCSREEDLKREEECPSPRVRHARPDQPDLYCEPAQREFASDVATDLRRPDKLGRPGKLAGWAAWFPAVIAEFFFRAGWGTPDRPTPKYRGDVIRAVVWAEEFFAIRATEAEVKDALSIPFGQIPLPLDRNEQPIKEPEAIRRYVFKPIARKRAAEEAANTRTKLAPAGAPAGPRVEDPDPATRAFNEAPKDEQIEFLKGYLPSQGFPITASVPQDVLRRAKEAYGEQQRQSASHARPEVAAAAGAEAASPGGPPAEEPEPATRAFDEAPEGEQRQFLRAYCLRLGLAPGAGLTREQLRRAKKAFGEEKSEGVAAAVKSALESWAVTP